MDHPKGTIGRLLKPIEGDYLYGDNVELWKDKETYNTMVELTPEEINKEMKESILDLFKMDYELHIDDKGVSGRGYEFEEGFLKGMEHCIILIKDLY